MKPLKIGDKVTESPVGSGTITSFTDRGYPRVNYVAVALLVRDDGFKFDPHGQYDAWKAQQAVMEGTLSIPALLKDAANSMKAAWIKLDFDRNNGCTTWELPDTGFTIAKHQLYYLDGPRIYSPQVTECEDLFYPDYHSTLEEAQREAQSWIERQYPLQITLAKTEIEGVNLLASVEWRDASKEGYLYAEIPCTQYTVAIKLGELLTGLRKRFYVNWLHPRYNDKIGWHPTLVRHLNNQER